MWIVVAAVVGAGVFGLRLWADLAPRGFWTYSIAFGTFFGFMLLTATALIMDLVRRYGRPAAMPTCFDVTPGAFQLQMQNPATFNAVFMLLFFGFIVPPFVAGWIERDDAISLVMTTIMLALYTTMIVLGVALGWRAISFELTPVGINFRGPLLQRSIPWESLAHGGPLRPSSVSGPEPDWISSR